MLRMTFACLALAGCVGASGSSQPCEGKCDGDAPVPSCTSQQAGPLAVYPAGSQFYYLPDRWVVSKISIKTPISGDIFPSDPFSASPEFGQCPLTVDLRLDADAGAVAAARAALGADAKLSVAPTSAIGERPFDLTFAAIDGLPPVDLSHAHYASQGDGTFEVVIPVPDADCSALTTLLVHQVAFTSVTSDRTMTCDGAAGSIPVAVKTLGSQLQYDGTGVDDDSSIFEMLQDIWDAQQAGALLDFYVDHGTSQGKCPSAASVLPQLVPAFDASIKSALNPLIAYGDGKVTLAQIHGGGEAAQAATVAFMQQVMTACGTTVDEAGVIAFLSRTDLSGDDYTGADNLLAQTYRSAGSLATYDPTAEHQTFTFEHP